MSSYRIADYIIDFISSIGVDKIFLLPGGGCMHLVDAVALNKNIEPITCQHEQAAVISAEAYGRVHKSGIGVAIVTSGPGSTNAITGVTGAWLESIPMIIISGQVKRSDLNIEKKVRQKGPQEIDIVTIVQSITKFSETIIDPSKIKKTLQKAYIEAKSGRKGPVWLDVPLDIQGTPIEKIKTSQNSWVDWKENPTLVHSELQKKIKACQSALKESIRPLILVGHGVRLAGASGDFTNFVNKLGIPVVSTWNALDLLEFNSPYYVGRPGVVASRAPNFAIQNCDLLISIGCRIDNIVSAFNQKDFARNAKKILIDCDINEINKVGYLLRTTAVYGSGKFGLSDFANTKEVTDFNQPFRAEMLSVYIIREFSVELVEHVAKKQNPNKAVKLENKIKQHLGIGNSTGLGMAPFIIKHPKLVNKWMSQYTESLNKIINKNIDSEKISSYLQLLEKALLYLKEVTTFDEYQIKKIQRMLKI